MKEWEIEAQQTSTSAKRLEVLAQTSITAKTLVAKNPSAPTQLLQKLANDSDIEVRKAVASNPNTPHELLLELGKAFPNELLNNPVFDLLLLGNTCLQRRIPVDSYHELLKKEDISTSLLEILTRNGDQEIAEAAKLHVKFAGEITDGWQGIAEEALKNIYYWEEIESFKNLSELLDLLPDVIINRIDVRQRIATNTPVPMVEKLAAIGPIDKIRLRDIVALNSSTPKELVEEIVIDLATKGSERICENLAQNPNTPTRVLQALSNSKFDCVLQHLALNPNTPDTTLEDLATDKHHICQAVAINPKTPIYLLEQLATYEYWEIRSSVAQNPNTPIALLEQLAKDKSSEVYLGVIKNPNAPVNLLIQAFNQSENDGLIRYTLAQNPSTPLNILEELASSASNPYILAKLASNPSSSSSILRLLASRCYSEDDKRYYFDDVLRSVIIHPHTPLDILEKLATEKCYEIRCTVASNPNIPILYFNS
ncbi:hypothetical protein [Nostoc sp. JL33]|uniref:hypothetical protein n=1 Tax=Nostoc sp. JL33 TaxID=2815396 RepID=UPI0025D4C610|nr:hypothetical protein [Nostoc sp. JL33]MBN3870976.1 hypothetical protein [Nostoc sp. JL33]